MTASTMYQLRLDPQEKAETFAVFESLGIKPAQAIRLFFNQVRQTQSIPFPVERVPNARTAKILLAPHDEKDYKRFDTVEALFEDLNS